MSLTSLDRIKGLRLSRGDGNVLFLGEPSTFSKQTEPFRDEEGKFATSSLRSAGFSPEDLTLAYISTSRQSPDGPRMPEPVELIEELSGGRIFDPYPLVILSGTIPCQIFFPFERPEKLRGRVFMLSAREDKLFIPTIGHRLAMRQPSLRDDFAADLEVAKKIHNDRDNWRDYMPYTCYECGIGEQDMEELHLDSRGMAWCQRHKQESISLCRKILGIRV